MDDNLCLACRETYDNSEVYTWEINRSHCNIFVHKVSHKTRKPTLPFPCKNTLTHPPARTAVPRNMFLLFVKATVGTEKKCAASLSASSSSRPRFSLRCGLESATLKKTTLGMIYYLSAPSFAEGLRHVLARKQTQAFESRCIQCVV